MANRKKDITNSSSNGNSSGNSYDLEQLYSNPKEPSSYGSIDILLGAAKNRGLLVGAKNRQDIRDFLASKESYTKLSVPKYQFRKRDIKLSYGYMDLCQVCYESYIFYFIPRF